MNIVSVTVSEVVLRSATDCRMMAAVNQKRIGP